MSNDTTNPSESWVAETEAVARAVRMRVLDHTLRNNGGYLSQACSSAEILSTLYTRIMRLGPSLGPPEPPDFAGVPGALGPEVTTGAAYNGPRTPELDRFIFSPVHYALVLYAVLIEVGRLSPSALRLFNQDGSRVELIGAEHSPGHEVTAGSLAQAISQAGGIALARKLRGEPGRVWVFLSDGELQEGQTWEAFAAMSYHGLDNIGVYIDVNAQQCDGAMNNVMSIEPLAARLEAFGVALREVDGHDVEALAGAAEDSAKDEGRRKPLVVIARTDPCRDIPLLRRRESKLHYVRFHDEAEHQEYLKLLRTMESEDQVKGEENLS